MSESAFGVEHGDEVSKAGFKMPGSFKPKKPTLLRPKVTYNKPSADGAAFNRTEKGPSTFMKPKSKTSVGVPTGNPNQVSSSTKGGGLTGAGKATAGTGVVGGAYAAYKAKQQKKPGMPR